MIEVRRTGDEDPMAFEVTLREGAGETLYDVTLSRAQHRRLTAERHTPEDCIEAVFRFLLDREPKEAIMARFDVAVVSRYFPEFENALGGYLDRS